MNRRDFSRDLLKTITSVALLDGLFRSHAVASCMRPIANEWLRELQTMCRDLRTATISQTEWQARITLFHERLPLEDLVAAIDFERAIASFEYPELGVVTKDPILPRIEGVERYAFTGRIFGMRRHRTIMPHGHANMTSCHRVLRGEVLLRQYDRVGDDPGHMLVRQTIEETGPVGSFSSVSDERNNVHWLIATSDHAFTFDVIVAGIEERPVEIHNLDMDAAVSEGNGVLRVPKIGVQEALAKYGRTHH